MNTKKSSKLLSFSIIATSMFMMLLGCSPQKNTPQTTFPYQITVKSSDTTDPIENAVVRLEVAGMAPISGSSDSFGNVYITIPNNYLQQSGHLTVEARNYKTLQQNVPLMKTLPSTVFLKPLRSIEEQYTAVPTLIETKIATLAPATPTTALPTAVSPTATPMPPTAIPPNTPTISTPTATTTATPLPVLPSPTPTATAVQQPSRTALSGKLAFPLKINDEYKVYVVQVGNTPPTRLYASIGNARQPQLSPDGSQLLVDGTGNADSGAILQMSSDGHGATPAACPSITVESYFPTWSPDGSRLAFDGGNIHPDRRQIYIDDLGELDCQIDDNHLTVQGGEAIENNGLYPLWASDNWLYFRSCATWNHNPGICGIWAAQMDGNGFDQITNNPNHIPTDADSRHLLFMYNNNGNWDVYAVNSHTGGAPRNLTQNENTDIWGTLSPDGQIVAFMSNRDGRWAIWLMNIDGSNPHRWLPIDTFNWGTVVPDEIYFQRMSWSR